jgi:Reverse transcriptase (RNA-dependent DNA polymerase)
MLKASIVRRSKSPWSSPLHLVCKTALITPFCLFEFIRLPFGLKNAGLTFQHMMDQVFADIPYMFIYLDDVLVASRSMADHFQHLHMVSLLLTNGLCLNAEKCVWAAQQVEFFGHSVLGAGHPVFPSSLSSVRPPGLPGAVQLLQPACGPCSHHYPPPNRGHKAGNSKLPWLMR